MTRYFIGTSEDDINDSPEFCNDLNQIQNDLQSELDDLTSDDMKDNPELTPRIFKVEVTKVA